ERAFASVPVDELDEVAGRVPLERTRVARGIGFTGETPERVVLELGAESEGIDDRGGIAIRIVLVAGGCVVVVGDGRDASGAVVFVAGDPSGGIGDRGGLEGEARVVGEGDGVARREDLARDASGGVVLETGG